MSPKTVYANVNYGFEDLIKNTSRVDQNLVSSSVLSPVSSNCFDFSCISYIMCHEWFFSLLVSTDNIGWVSSMRAWERVFRYFPSNWVIFKMLSERWMPRWPKILTMNQYTHWIWNLEWMIITRRFNENEALCCGRTFRLRIQSAKIHKISFNRSQSLYQWNPKMR